MLNIILIVKRFFMIYKNNFSLIISALRKEHKLTLVQLSDILGVTNPLVSAWEKGKAVPSFDIFLALADYFQVPLDYLVGRDVDSDRPLPAVTPDELALVEKLRALPPEKRQTVETLLNQL